MVLPRLVDGVDPGVVDGVRAAAASAPGVEEVAGVRVRWLGHRLRAEIEVIVDPDLTVEEGHKIAKEVGHQLLRRLPYLSEATVHVDPPGAPGEAYHRDDHRDEGSPTGRDGRRP
jgi:divalent metal cation (Fe/Co/Zn/Cd) transporter